jgi:hypothetical protein
MGVGGIIMQDWIDAARLNIIVGHFGSGKTEVSLNLAFSLADRGHRFALADLDIVDPYFRSRECHELLEARGGRVITSSQQHMDADLPALPPDIFSFFAQPEWYGVMDIGGNPAGARVLARYRHDLKRCHARVLCVVNANRPLSDTPEKAVYYIREIEKAAGLKINGIVHNTHCCQLTEIDDIRNGAEMAEKVSALTDIPIVCHAVSRNLAEAVTDFVNPVFPMDIYMKKPWE